MTDTLSDSRTSARMFIEGVPVVVEDVRRRTPAERAQVLETSEGQVRERIDTTGEDGIGAVIAQELEGEGDRDGAGEHEGGLPGGGGAQRAAGRAVGRDGGAGGVVGSAGGKNRRNLLHCHATTVEDEAGRVTA